MLYTPKMVSMKDTRMPLEYAEFGGKKCHYTQEWAYTI